MALPTADDLNANLLALPPTANKIPGITAFVDVIGDFMDQVQAGPTGSPGIFALNRPVMVNLLKDQNPVPDNTWVLPFVNAWESAVLTGTIVPGTVLNPAWTGSGLLDVATVPSPAVTILTISSAKTILMNGLLLAAPDSTAALPFAEAIRNATLAFTFTCIGLGPPPPLTPIPLPFNAQ